MPKKLVRRGRVQGYRPTREQLAAVLRLAQKDIDEDSQATLVYSQGSEEIYSKGSGGKILPENLDQLIRDADDPRELNNLYFSISQDSPVRRVEIEIGPGDWTRYLIESDDQTWAHGRYHEITEEVLAHRSLYARGHSSAPQVPKEGTDAWRPAAWELTNNPLANGLSNLVLLLWAILPIEPLVVLISLYFYHNLEQDHKALAQVDRNNAAHILNWFIHNSAILFLLNLSYIAMTISLSRLMKKLLKSKVILHADGGSFFSQLVFQRNREDAVAQATLYLTFLLVLLAILPLLV